MKIVLPKTEETMARHLVNQLEEAITTSRFTAEFEIKMLPKACIDIRKVRLRRSKAFCGNHPNACVLGGVDAKRSFLEGADWIEMNELINDVLDRNYSGATAFSRPIEIKDKLYVRKDGHRRISYGSQEIVNGGRLLGNVWLGDEPGVYVDCRGKESPITEFPDGTPGIYQRAGYFAEG